MFRSPRALVYLLALSLATALSFAVAGLALPSLPDGPGGALLALGIAAAVALPAAALEGPLWRGRPRAPAFRARRGLKLLEEAPPPLALGIFLGAYLASRLL